MVLKDPCFPTHLSTMPPYLPSRLFPTLLINCTNRSLSHYGWVSPLTQRDLAEDS